MKDNIKLLKNKQLLIPINIIKYLDKSLSLVDFLVLVYLDNQNKDTFDAEEIALNLGLTNDEVMQSFNNLILKQLVEVKTAETKEGKIYETISLDAMYELAANGIENEKNKKETNDIFDKFENEFGRTLSPTEFEIINGWLETGYDKKLILEALKEAIYNGAKSLRYIDKVLYEWSKKGLKTVEEVNDDLKNEPEEKTVEFFDYDWLNDED